MNAVYIPTTTIMTADAYQEITHRLLARIIDAEYPLSKPIMGDSRKAHGLDTGKMHAAALFYLPSQPRDQSGRCFKIFNEDGRAALDPVAWIDEREIVEFEPVATVVSSAAGKADEMRVENAIQQWRAEGCSPGRGNAEFFKLATRLANAGLAELDVNQILVEQAYFAHTPKDRIRDVPRILKQLRNEGKFNGDVMRPPVYAANAMAVGWE